jgi:hypothetical protein
VVFVGLAAIASAAPAGAAEQTVMVMRPAGQLVMELRGSQLRVIDTRSDDPGWTVTGTAEGVAIALKNHGLGIAELTMADHGDTITITVI